MDSENTYASLFHFSSNDFCDFPYSPGSSSWSDSDRSPGIGANPSPAAIKLQSRLESQTKALDIMSSFMEFPAPGTFLLSDNPYPGKVRARSLGEGPKSRSMPENRI